jgi:hypothetical protein
MIMRRIQFLVVPRPSGSTILCWPRKLRHGSLSQSAMQKQQPGPATISITILIDASQRTNTKLRDVAAELVQTGTLPSRR